MLYWLHEDYTFVVQITNQETLVLLMLFYSVFFLTTNQNYKLLYFLTSFLDQELWRFGHAIGDKAESCLNLLYPTQRWRNATHKTISSGRAKLLPRKKNGIFDKNFMIWIRLNIVLKDCRTDKK